MKQKSASVIIVNNQTRLLVVQQTPLKAMNWFRQPF